MIAISCIFLNLKCPVNLKQLMRAPNIDLKKIYNYNKLIIIFQSLTYVWHLFFPTCYSHLKSRCGINKQYDFWQTSCCCEVTSCTIMRLMVYIPYVSQVGGRGDWANPGSITTVLPDACSLSRPHLKTSLLLPLVATTAVRPSAQLTQNEANKSRVKHTRRVILTSLTWACRVAQPFSTFWHVQQD